MADDKAKVKVEKTVVADQGPATHRVPQLGDSILYTLGTISKYSGEERAGTITKVLNAEEKVVQFNVHAAHFDDFPKSRDARIPSYPVAPNSGPYDPTGKPGTWRYASDARSV